MTVDFSRGDGLDAMPAAELRADFPMEILAYPLTPAVQTELIQLLRTAWTQTDYNWTEAMGGDYSESLVIATVLGRRGGTAVATATIHFARHRPEVAVLGNVLTHPDHRGQGLAGRTIARALQLAAEAGCRVCLLGTTMRPRNLYQDHGFAWHGGAVMRCALGAGTLETSYFAAGQSAAVRPAHWGDLPGLTLLLAQTLAGACPDFPRGLVSGRHANAERCLSNFPILWYETAARDGVLAVLAENETHRVFGFGSVTRAPGPARRHTATLDFSTHQDYTAHLPSLLTHLLDACRAGGVQRAFAYVADSDTSKHECLRSSGFGETARLPGAMYLGETYRDAIVFTGML